MLKKNCKCLWGLLFAGYFILLIIGNVDLSFILPAEEVENYTASEATSYLLKNFQIFPAQIKADELITKIKESQTEFRLALDTLLLGIQEENGMLILKVKVLNNSNEEIYASLECNQEIISRFYGSSAKQAMLAVDVNNVTKKTVSYELKDMEDNIKSIITKEKVLLSGKCVEFLPVAGV